MIELMLLGDSYETPVEDDLTEWSWPKAIPEYHGVIQATDLITGDALSALVNLTTGKSVNSTAGWLSFTFRTKQLYVAKMPIRTTLSYTALSNADLITGTKVVNIAGKNYKVRLLKGLRYKVYSKERGSDISTSYYSEWNKLMYLASDGNFPNAGSALVREGLSGITLGGFDQKALGTDISTWTIEADTTQAISRGGQNTGYVDYSNRSTSVYTFGWRPVLELID